MKMSKFFVFAVWFAVACSKLAVASVLTQQGEDPNQLDGYCKLIENGFSYNKGFPTSQAVVDLVGPWASRLPPRENGEILRSGKVGLFEDSRIDFFMKHHDVRGDNILEFGPLEGGHTYMLHNSGAKSIIGVEGSPAAYMKLVVTKDLYNLNRAEYLFGNFIEYAQRAIDKKVKFDSIIFVGVLYHMTEPVKILKMLSQLTDNLMIWTQVYHHFEGVSANDNYNWQKGQEIVVSGYAHTPHCHIYQKKTAVYLGGQEPSACWLKREDVIGSLKQFGFSTIEVMGTKAEELSGQNGAQLTVFASRSTISNNNLRTKNANRKNRGKEKKSFDEIF